MRPTNPELDIQPTGKCEVWIREINQIAQVKLARTEAHRIDTEIPTSPTNYATLPQVSDATRACIYTPDGKCVGMLSTKLYINLANAFHHAWDLGYHNQVVPLPKDLKSELFGLLSYKKECTSKVHKQISQKVKDLHMRALPDHILQALQAWAMVTKDRTASDSSFGSSIKEVWSKRKRDMVFGSNFNPLATKLTGLSVCHPLRI